MRIFLTIVCLLTILGSASFARHYNHGGEIYFQESYYKPSSDTWVGGHFKTRPDEYKWNNLSD